jgi:hypothetical protein
MIASVILGNLCTDIIKRVAPVVPGTGHASGLNTDHAFLKESAI